MTKVALIYNALNKSRIKDDEIRKIKEFFSQNNYVLNIYQTSGFSRCNDIITNNYADIYIVAGGDGTLNEAVNSKRHDLKILYIPTGTVNDFGASLKLKNNISELLNLVKHNSLVKIDTGVVNDKKFNYVLAAGELGKISYLTPHSLKNKLGRFAYVLYALISLKEMFKHLEIEYEFKGVKTKVSCDFIFITNTNSISSFRKMYRTISLSDGYFECLIVKRTNKIKQIYLGLKCLIFGIDKVNSKHLLRFKFDKLSVKAKSDVQWIIDGEQGPMGNIEVEVLKQNLSIYTKRREINE